MKPTPPATPAPDADTRIASIGLLAGLLNGMIAIGGGIIIVPGLVRHRGASPQVAVGTSLTAVVAMSGVAFAVHVVSSGLGQPPLALLTTIVAGVLGARLGARVLSRLSTRRMLLAFAVFVLLMSAKLISGALGLDFGGDADRIATPLPPPAWSYPAIGWVSGIASGLFGVGGGALVILGFAVFFGVPVGAALPLALAINVTNALAGSVGHARAGRVLWADVVRMLPAAALGIGVGTLLAMHLPARMLTLCFGLFFAFNAVLLLRRALAA